MRRTALLSLLTSLFFAAACSDSNDGNPVGAGTNQSQSALSDVTVEDLPADPERSGAFTYFSLRQNAVVDIANAQSNRWDLAFNATTILTNSGTSGPGQGGGMVMTGVDYDSLGELPADGWLTDADGAPALAQSSWYTYTGADSNPPHAILSNPGVVLAVRTGDGRFAKVQIMSYYKGGAAIPTGAEGEASRFYTFRFVFQSDGSRKVN